MRSRREQVSLNCDAEQLSNWAKLPLMYTRSVRLEESTVNRFVLSLLAVVALSACSGPEDVLENIGDVSVPDQLTGCVARSDDGSCEKAVCVADEGSDCESWVKACEEHGHVVDVRDGHDTCERKKAAE